MNSMTMMLTGDLANIHTRKLPVSTRKCSFCTVENQCEIKSFNIFNS